MNQFLLQLLNGLVVGSSLALVASGLALLFGVLDIINFAQGEFFMLGAYILWIILGATHNYVLGLIAAGLVLAIGGGLLLLVITWPLLGKAQVLILLATLGVSLILQQLALNIFGGDAKIMEPPIAEGVDIGPITYPLYDLIIIAVGMGLLLAGFFWLRYAKYGVWVRAVAQNRSMAAVLGVPVPRVYLLAFMISSGLAGIAGGMLAPVTSVFPSIGGSIILNSLIVVVAGGLGNFRGAAWIAILFGEIQSVGSIWIPPVVVQLLLFGLVILLLVLRSRRKTALVRL
ncbi:MAG TPA: branched-chain amino acid ABC transporter permease [Chloroflexota bacterium]|nr:branched-chain amino acid ABC transporter permease [Chloroflexota bacterium]